MHEGVVIRPAETVWDALAMRRARNSCREFMTRDTSRKTVAGQLAWWWFYRPESLHPFVVEVGDGVVGYAILCRDDERAWLTAGLLPSVRGQGVGVDVFRWLTQRAQSMGLRPSLEVLLSNEPARRVYRNLGFINTIQRGKIMIMEKR